MNKFELRTNKKKETIILSASKLFSEKGFSAVSIKEIAALAEVSQVSIYNYFGSKDALVTECVMLMMRDILESTQDILSKDKPFLEKLFEAISLCNIDLSQSIHTYFGENALTDIAFLKLLKENVNQLKLNIYRSYIELGKKEGLIDASLSTATILKFLEAINHVGADQDPAQIQETHQETLHLLLYGLIGSPK